MPSLPISGCSASVSIRLICHSRSGASRQTLERKSWKCKFERHLWYKDAIIYQLHVKPFDSNNDGIGDFPGLISKLDYIADLGVNAIWVLPFYPSPLFDDGYDISGYRDVHPEYGALDDFRQFVRAVHARDIRVITDLEINHAPTNTLGFSEPGGQSQDRQGANFYVWSDNDQKYAGTRIIISQDRRRIGATRPSDRRRQAAYSVGNSKNAWLETALYGAVTDAQAEDCSTAQLG